MGIDDSDPERRNLIVTSLAFIVFYLADGKMTPGPITLQVIPVTFENVLALELFAWVMLIWFGLRYWQTHRASYRNAYMGYSALYNAAGDVGAKYLEKVENIPPSIDEAGRAQTGYFGSELIWDRSKLIIRYNFQEFHPIGDRAGSLQRIVNSRTAALEGNYGRWIRLKYITSFAVKSPGFTSYAMPYIVFFAAISLAAIKGGGAVISSFSIVCLQRDGGVSFLSFCY